MKIKLELKELIDMLNYPLIDDHTLGKLHQMIEMELDESHDHLGIDYQNKYIIVDTDGDEVEL